MTEIDFLVQAGRFLQNQDESFPVVLQRVLDLAERSWPPLRASLTLAGGTVLVTGRSEFPTGGPVARFSVPRGTRLLGTLSFEVPAGDEAPSGPSPTLWETLALMVAQESEIRRLGGPTGSSGGGLIGSSGAMQEVMVLVDRAARGDQPVLLLGEPGVGKESLAEEIHRRSNSAAGPFVAFNGTALPEAMVETELFGHPRGAGGRFAEARGGTLFLGEIGDLSLPVQSRLARALASRAVPFRLIASTCLDLDTLVRSGRLRPDLYQQLAVFPIQVPPLRDRGADIIALADHYVTLFSLRTGRTIKRISTPTLEMLMTYHWPGNIRELQNVLERAVLLSDDEVLHGYHLPPSLQSSVHSGTRMHGRLADRLDSLEYEMIVEALKASQGNITQAARELGLSKRIMGLRLDKYELDYRTFRKGPADLAEDPDWN